MSGYRISVVLISLVVLLLVVVCIRLDSSLGEISLNSYLIWEFSTQPDRIMLEQPRDLLVCVVCELPQDGMSEQIEQVMDSMTRIAKNHVDYTGRNFRFTFACPVYNWNESEMTRLKDWCATDLGEIELLMPSDYPGTDSLRWLLEKTVLFPGRSRFAIIRQAGQPSNSRTRRDTKAELILLRDFGCYADLSFPDPASSLQPLRINSITSVSHQADSDNPYDDAIPIKSGTVSFGDLFVIDGPTIIDWANWNDLFSPTVDFGRLSYNSPPDTARIDRWIRANVHVDGQPNWVFVKLILSDDFLTDSSLNLLNSYDQVLDCLERRFVDGDEFRLHYVTAHEMYNIARAAEAGKIGSAANYVDYKLTP